MYYSVWITTARNKALKQNKTKKKNTKPCKKRVEIPDFSIMIHENPEKIIKTYQESYKWYAFEAFYVEDCQGFNSVSWIKENLF